MTKDGARSRVVLTGWRETRTDDGLPVTMKTGQVEGLVSSPRDVSRLEREAQAQLGGRSDHVSAMFYRTA